MIAAELTSETWLSIANVIQTIMILILFMTKENRK